MKIVVYSTCGKKKIENKIKKHGFALSERNPDFVIAYGGDGTILRAERKYPGVPKIPIRKKSICKKCKSYEINDLDYILDKLKNKEYRIEKKKKVEARIGGKRLTALNEIQVRNKMPCMALRFSMLADNRKFGEVIGDGVVVATSYGSTGYYRAIGYKPFFKGIMLGFNNVYPKKNPIRIHKKVEITILREKALIIADNNEDMIEVMPGKTVEIRESPEKALFVKIKL